MNITPDCVVALTWVLKDTQGELLDELDDPVEFYLGGHDLLDKIQHALQDHQVGDQIDLHLEPEDAFGDFDESLIFLEPRGLFPEGLEEGMTIEGHALPAACSSEKIRVRCTTCLANGCRMSSKSTINDDEEEE